MRKALKFFHTAASCGLTGAIVGYAVLLMYAQPNNSQSYADMRQVIGALCNYVLVPSMAVALVSGLLSMAVHRPFQEKRWVWIKAVLGLSTFEATLSLTSSKANYAATVSAEIAAGKAPADALGTALQSEWNMLGIILTLAAVNIALGVWRPKLRR